MGKHTSDAQKARFLTLIECGTKQSEAARSCGLERSTAFNIKKRAGDLMVQHTENGLPPPTIDEQVARKPGSGRPPLLTDHDCQEIFRACTSSKSQRRKRQHYVAAEEGFNACRRTIETRMRKLNLYRTKPTKKLHLTDVQMAQRYELALSREHWGYAE